MTEMQTMAGIMAALLLAGIGCTTALFTSRWGRRLARKVRRINTTIRDTITCGACRAVLPTTLLFECDRCGFNKTRNIASACPICGFRGAFAPCPACGESVRFG